MQTLQVKMLRYMKAVGPQPCFLRYDMLSLSFGFLFGGMVTHLHAVEMCWNPLSFTNFSLRKSCCAGLPLKSQYAWRLINNDF